MISVKICKRHKQSKGYFTNITVFSVTGCVMPGPCNRLMHYNTILSSCFSRFCTIPVKKGHESKSQKIIIYMRLIEQPLQV